MYLGEWDCHGEAFRGVDTGIGGRLDHCRVRSWHWRDWTCHSKAYRCGKGHFHGLSEDNPQPYPPKHRALRD